MKTYRLSKSRSILKWGCNRYKKKHQSLTATQKERLEELLESLDNAVLKGDRQEASDWAHKLEDYGEEPLKKSFFEQIKEFSFVLIVAVLVATLIRQLVFEAYEIPTGSMRPTFREHDDVLVSKTAFGINMPFATDHIYFDPGLVQRTGIVIFSGDNIDLPDTDSHYLWVFPYKKRYIKRLMGKPGDTVYFYGGRIYGIDRQGETLNELSTSPWIESITYVPYIYQQGFVSRPKRNEFVLSQMHEDIGRIQVLPFGQFLGEIYTGKEWIKDDPQAALKEHNSIKTFSDFWGIKNYAVSRLLTKKELDDRKDLSKEGLEEGLLYLEIKHTPSVNSSNASLQQNPPELVTTYTTLIPLNQEHIDELMKHMYTARFTIKDGKAVRYSHEKARPQADSPAFAKIPDGTYEFYNGVAQEIGFGSIARELHKDHPIYSHDPEYVQKLYNYGIEFNTRYAPTMNALGFPSRYTFFRNGELFTLNGAIFKKDDPILAAFNQREEKKQTDSSERKPYVAFKDYGPPLKKDGSIDKEFIQAFGLKIPEKKYLVLGDNHAMSGDSRVFGFVPQENLQGAPDLILWPPGSRWGCPPQKTYPWFNIPRTIVWSIIGLIALIWWWIARKNRQQKQFHKL
jgi:signal peptidase I